MTDRPELRDALLRELDEDGEGDLETASALALLAYGVVPPRALRERFERSIRAQHRFDDLETSVASLIDLEMERTRELLSSIDAPIGSAWERAAWMPATGPGIELLHFEGGPSLQRAIAGFVRIAPGIAFPEHEHVGEEAVLVLQGSFRDSDGSVHGRGELVRMAAGSQHAIEAVGPLALVYLAIVHTGVRIGGELFAPDDPRI